MAEPAYLDTSQGARIAYHLTPGHGPGVVFMTGFMSDMEGAKALRLQEHLQKRGNRFLRFDYRGHGRSSDRFEQGSIGDWAQDALAVLDQLTEGPQVLVGSSMGGWIMLLTARQRQERVAGLVGVATAADFTDHIPAQLREDQRRQLEEAGQVSLQSCYDERSYVITRHLIEEGAGHRLLDKPIPFDGPVRLIHGMQDDDVPWQNSLRIAERLTSARVETQLVKNGDHRLSEPADLDRLCRTLDALLDELEAAPAGVQP